MPDLCSFKKKSGAGSAAVVLGYSANALGAVRSLATAGIRTIAIAFNADDPLLRSRFGEKVLLSSKDDLCNKLLEKFTHQLIWQKNCVPV